MVASSWLDKNEQLVNVATPSPATTHEAARNRKEERDESMTCTIILIQKSITRAQLAARNGRDKRDLSGYLVCLVHQVSLMQPNKPDNPTDQMNKTGRWTVSTACKSGR